MAKREHGQGSIEERGGLFRLRFRINGRKQSVTMPEGTTAKEARARLTKLVHDRNEGKAVESSKGTVTQWIDRWIGMGAPGPRNRKRVGQRTLERYGQLLNTHAKPKFGDKALQKLSSADIDDLYVSLEGKIAPRTAHHVHTVLKSCLGTALLSGLIVANPVAKAVRIPDPNPKPQAVDFDDDGADDEIDDHEAGLTEKELADLIAGFKVSSIYPIVVLAAATGMRRNEILALRWTDLDVEAKTLRVRRAWELTKKFGLRLKPPKTARGIRDIDLDDATIAMLLAEKEKWQRAVAGIPDGAVVNLALVKLPAKALMFPSVHGAGKDMILTKPPHPRNVTKEFRRVADKLGFGIRLHTLRGIHATALLDAGIPVDVVARRIGDDAAVLLRSYMKRKRSKTAGEQMADTLTALTAGFLKP